jgi:hypothetical protein
MKMTNEEMRLMVAEALSWTYHENDASLWYHPDSPLCPDGKYIGIDEVPDLMEFRDTREQFLDLFARYKLGLRQISNFVTPPFMQPTAEARMAKAALSDPNFGEEPQTEE